MEGAVQSLSCVWPSNPLDCSMPGFPVHHQLPELAQIHVHRWCHPIILCSVVPFSCLQIFPASGSFPLSCFLRQVASVLEIQHQSFQWVFRTNFLYDRLVGFPCGPRDSQVSSPTSQFKSINSLELNFFMVQLSFIHDCWKDHIFDQTDLCRQSNVSAL